MGESPDFRTLFDTLAVPYAVIDRQFRYVALNDMVEELVGRQRSEMLGENLFRLFPEIEERQSIMEAAFSAAFDGKPTSMAEVPYALPIPGKPGEQREIWWTFHCHPIPQKNGTVEHIGFHAENITREVEARSLSTSISQELQHRVKNTLALVQIIARQTANSYRDIDTFIDTFDDRIVSLARTHALLTGTNWDGLTFDALVDAQLATHCQIFGDRITIAGPALLLSSSEAQALSMALHELSTNAMKYGALSNDTGKVHIEWETHGVDGYTITWSETGLPNVETPSHEGFGTVILNRILPAQIGGKANHRFTPKTHLYKISVDKRR